jgi:small neutral amino acid transporter SnatA (MarC family)
MNDYDKTLNRIVRGAGILVILISLCIIYTGIKKFIPLLGVTYGGIFIAGGVFFLLLGILFLVLPGRKARKKAKREKEEAKMREKILNEMDKK